MTGRYLLLLFGSTLCAASVHHIWAKPESVWTEADAERVISDSPWAKSTPIAGDASAIVRWEDSQPVRQALLRLGKTPAVEGEQQFYALAVRGPLPASEPANGTQKNWRASLSVPGNWNLEASDVRFVTRKDESLVVFLFPRQGPVHQPNLWGLPFGVVLPSWKAEFKAWVGKVQIVQSFPLDKMWYLGRIEL